MYNLGVIKITFTANNEVELLYPSHPNQEYFKNVSDFISKCCLKEAFTRSPTQYKEYLSEFWYTAKTLEGSKVWVSTPTGGVRGDIGITNFRNALREQYLPHSSMYVLPPSITIVRPWFATIGYKGEIGTKGTLKKSFLPPRWTVDYAKIIWEDLIHKLNKKSRGKIVPYPRFISLLLEHMMPNYDNEELTISHTQVPQGKKPGAKSGLKRKQSSKHISESKTEASKSKTGQSEKDTQSNSAKDKSSSHPSPPTLVVGNMHKEAQQAADGPTSLGATSEEVTHPQLSSGSNLNVLVDKTKSAGDGLKTAHIDSGVNEASRADDILLKVKLEDLSDILKDTRFAFFTLDSPPDKPITVSYKSEKEEEVSNDKDIDATSHDVPEDTLLPPPPSPKSAQIQELMAQVAELKNIQWELPAEFLNLPSQVSSVQEKLKTLDSLPSLLHKVTDTLNRFATMVENSSGATSMNVPSAVDLLGKNVVTQYYTKKLLFDKYCDKMLKRKKSPKITNYELLTKKGPITLKIYREDGSDEVISNLKTRLDQLTQTEQELKIDLNKPFKEQDHLNELNELDKKKRKRTSDLKDHSKSTKKHKSSMYATVQKLKKDSWKELQFSLVDNSKLNVGFYRQLAMGSGVHDGYKLLNESLLERLSCNIFITNFPVHLSAKKLWNTCAQYGTVQDVYIPKKFSKHGKEVQECHDTPVLILEWGSLNYGGDHVLVGCVKDFKTLPNIHNVCLSEGFSKEGENDDQVIPNSFQSIVNEYNVVENSPDDVENSPRKMEKQLENSHIYVENSHVHVENSLKQIENSTVHVENFHAHVKNSHDLSGVLFGLEKLILESEKKRTNVEQEASGSDPLFPLGVPNNMSPAGSKHGHVDSLAPSLKPVNGFSILECFEEFINIGQAMGFGMKGCEKDYRRIIISMGDHNNFK
ncbi:retrovirus-related pol polyprotein from transposon TNT 1-94 [Tanacetum coccineum]